MKIELNELFGFFRHPQRYFFIRQLGMRFNPLETKIEEREPFAVTKLDGYGLYQEWIATLLNGKTVSVKKMQAKGQWPSGVVGELAFYQQQQKLVEFVQKIRAKNLGNPIDDLSVNLTIDNKYHLVGKLEHRYEHGNLIYRYARLKGKDFVNALLHHLISNQFEKHSTHLLSDGDELTFTSELANTEYLSAWLALYEQGQQHPHAFFVEAAFEYIRQHNKKNAKIAAITKAEELLATAITKDYEPELKLLSRNLREIKQLLNQDFEEQCQQLLQTAWTETQKTNKS